MSRLSRLMMAPTASAWAKSASGVSLLESMTRSPVTPAAWARVSSVAVAQSQPQPSSARMETIQGLGVALTAKYSQKPGFQANAALSARARWRIWASS